jgi:hypothetical protein
MLVRVHSLEGFSQEPERTRTDILSYRVSGLSGFGLSETLAWLSTGGVKAIAKRLGVARQRDLDDQADA